MASSKITTKDLSEPVVETLNTIDTVANQVSVVDSNVSTLLNRLSDTRAANLDLLNNSTYGLSALKTAINTVNTAVSSNSSMGSTSDTGGTATSGSINAKLNTLLNIQLGSAKVLTKTVTSESSTTVCNLSNVLVYDLTIVTAGYSASSYTASNYGEGTVTMNGTAKTFSSRASDTFILTTAGEIVDSDSGTAASQPIYFSTFKIAANTSIGTSSKTASVAVTLTYKQL